MVLHPFCYHILCCECVKKKEKPVISRPFGLIKSVNPKTNLIDKENNESLNYKAPITQQPVSETVPTKVVIPKINSVENESNNLNFSSDLQNTNAYISAIPIVELEQDNLTQSVNCKEILNATSDILSYTIIENDDTRITVPRNESEHIKKPIPLPRFNKVGRDEHFNNVTHIYNECINGEIENDKNEAGIVFDAENLDELENNNNSETIVNNNKNLEAHALPFPRSIFVEPESKQLEEACLNSTITDDFEYKNAKIENIINEQNIDVDTNNQEEILNDNKHIETRAVPFPTSKLVDSSLSTYVPVYGKPSFIVPDKEVQIKFNFVAKHQ